MAGLSGTVGLLLRSVGLMRRIIMKLSKRLSLRFLRRRQAQLELQLTKPNLSAAETRRLERQKAYTDLRKFPDTSVPLIGDKSG
jgi:hypothetical protein